jgi:hypothetical protein
MANGVRMVGASRFEKLLEVIGRLPHLVLDVALSSSDTLLIRVIGVLVVVTLIGAGSDHDSLGLPLWPRLVAFVTPFHAVASCLEGRPSTAIRGRIPITQDQNGSDHLIDRGVPGGNVEQLLHGLWLIMIKLMH